MQTCQSVEPAPPLVLPLEAGRFSIPLPELLAPPLPLPEVLPPLVVLPLPPVFVGVFVLVFVLVLVLVEFGRISGRNWFSRAVTKSEDWNPAATAVNSAWSVAFRKRVPKLVSWVVAWKRVEAFGNRPIAPPNFDVSIPTVVPELVPEVPVPEVPVPELPVPVLLAPSSASKLLRSVPLVCACPLSDFWVAWLALYALAIAIRSASV